MEQRELTCIGCPMGCQIMVEIENGEVITVRGNTCKIGDTYARKEVTAPSRIVTSTVQVEQGALAVASVKTKGDVPREKVFEVAKALQSVVLKAPVTIGQVVLADVCQTGVDVIATKNVAYQDGAEG